MPAVPAAALGGDAAAEPSAAIRGRVVAARSCQERRLATVGARVNAELQGRAVWRLCRPEPAARQLLERAVERLGLSARGYHRVLKVARTIADLAGSGGLQAQHVAEALQYRFTDDQQEASRW